MGRTVISLIDSELGAGNYSIEWDGIDFEGSDQVSGIYVYILDVYYSKGHKTLSRKLIKK